MPALVGSWPCYGPRMRVASQPRPVTLALPWGLAAVVPPPPSKVAGMLTSCKQTIPDARLPIAVSSNPATCGVGTDRPMDPKWGSVGVGVCSPGAFVLGIRALGVLVTAPVFKLRSWQPSVKRRHYSAMACWFVIGAQRLHHLTHSGLMAN
jgi:hypothetical protein